MFNISGDDFRSTVGPGFYAQPEFEVHEIEIP